LSPARHGKPAATVAMPSEVFFTMATSAASQPINRAVFRRSLA